MCVGAGDGSRLEDADGVLSALARARAALMHAPPPMGTEWAELTGVMRAAHADVRRVLVLPVEVDAEPTRRIVLQGEPLAGIVVERHDGSAMSSEQLGPDATAVLDLLADLAGLALTRGAIDGETASRLPPEQTSLLEHVNDAVLAHDLDGRITYWNPRAEDSYGWRAEEVLGRDLDDVLATVFPDGLDRQGVNAILLDEETWEGELAQTTRGGRRLAVISRKALLRDAEGVAYGILTVNSDITERRLTEEALARSEELFRSQFEHSAVGQAIRSVDGTIESINPALVRMLRYPDTAAMRSDLDRLFAAAPPEVDVLRQEMLDGRRDFASLEFSLPRADGTDQPVRYTTSLVRSSDGVPLRFVSHFIDLADVRQAEARRDRAEQALMDRLEELDASNRLKTDLVGMLGHELKNPLAVLAMAAEVAEATWAAEAGPGERHFVDLVVRNAARLTQTVREVLHLVASEARELTAHPREVRVADVVAAVLRMEDQATVEVDDPEAVGALVQPDHLEQILANLVGNARKYAGGVERIVVTRVRDQVLVDVVDAGPGVSPEFVDSLFGRFARADETAAVVDGTGLGLYLVRELARANGGDVLHVDRPAGGATFRVLLPAVTNVIAAP